MKISLLNVVLTIKFTTCCHLSFYIYIILIEWKDVTTTFLVSLILDTVESFSLIKRCLIKWN